MIFRHFSKFPKIYPPIEQGNILLFLGFIQTFGMCQNFLVSVYPPRFSSIFPKKYSQRLGLNATNMEFGISIITWYFFLICSLFFTHQWIFSCREFYIVLTNFSAISEGFISNFTLCQHTFIIQVTLIPPPQVVQTPMLGALFIFTNPFSKTRGSTHLIYTYILSSKH